MKRIIVWVYSKMEDLEKALREIEESLKSVGSWFKIVSVQRLEWLDSKQPWRGR